MGGVGDKQGDDISIQFADEHGSDSGEGDADGGLVKTSRGVFQNRRFIFPAKMPACALVLAGPTKRDTNPAVDCESFFKTPREVFWRKTNI